MTLARSLLGLATLAAPLALPAVAAAQWQPTPVRGFTEPAPMPPRYDAGAVPPPEPQTPHAGAMDPASLGPGQFAFEVGSGVPVVYGSVDLGLGRGFDLGVEAAYHVDSTMRLAARAQWGIGWEKLFLASALEAALPVYLEDRDVAPDSINDADFSFALRVRVGVRLGPGASLYLEPIARLTFDGNPPVDALSGGPQDTEIAGALGAGVGAAMRLTGPLGLHAIARGESGANRTAQAVEFRFGLTLTTDAFLRPEPREPRRSRRETASR